MANSFAAKSYPLGLDLSQNNSLHSLEVIAASLDNALGKISSATAQGFLIHTLVTTRLLVPFQVVVYYVAGDFRGIQKMPGSNIPRVCEMSQVERVEEAAAHHRRFEVLNQLNHIRNFSLLMVTFVREPAGESAAQMLREAVRVEEENYGLFCQPSFSHFSEITENPFLLDGK